jgi:uncharacterized protein (DUF608 family)
MYISNCKLAVFQFILCLRRNGQTVYQKVLTGKKKGRSLKAWEWGVPLGEATYHALFPRAWTVYNIPEQQVCVTCRQISPVWPHEYKVNSRQISPVWPHKYKVTSRQISPVWTHKYKVYNHEYMVRQYSNLAMVSVHNIINIELIWRLVG